MNQPTINEERFKIFSDLYQKSLADAIRNYPGDYSWGSRFTVESVSAHMFLAIRAGTFNKDGRALKAVCKVLKIKHTYKAIYSYLAGED